MQRRTQEFREKRHLLHARLWLKAFIEVARWRATMIWMFYSPSKKTNNF